MARGKQAFHFKHMSLILLCLTALALCLSACAQEDGTPSKKPTAGTKIIENFANFPNTMKLDRLFLGYPDDLSILNEHGGTKLTTKDAIYSGTRTLLSNDDRSILFSVTVYFGLGLDEARVHVDSLPEEARNNAEELEEKLHLEENFYENITWHETESILLNGRDAFISGMSRDTSEGLTHWVSYYVSINENTVGEAKVYYTDTQYAKNHNLYDGIFASIAVG